MSKKWVHGFCLPDSLKSFPLVLKFHVFTFRDPQKFIVSSNENSRNSSPKTFIVRFLKVVFVKEKRGTINVFLGSEANLLEDLEMKT